MDAKLPMASTNETAKWSREADEFCRVVLEPEEQPLFISDEASLWDLFAGDPAQLIERAYAHYGVRLNLDQFSTPFWELLKFLSDKRPSTQNIRECCWKRKLCLGRVTRTKSLEQELADFLASLCVNWGFCSMPDDERSRLANSQHLTAHEFALAVLKGEGFREPEVEVQHIRRLKAAFLERFGSAVISAEDFVGE